MHVRPVGGGDARALSAPGEAETYPVWSPDGRWIATEVRAEQGTVVGVHPARLGQVLRGKLTLTPELAQRIHAAIHGEQIRAESSPA